jgi:hypothetical protein
MSNVKYELVGSEADSPAPSGESSFRLKKANLAYLGLFVIAAALCFIVYNTGDKWIGRIIKTKYSCKTDKVSIAVSLVARTSSAIAVFFLVHSILLVYNPNLVDSCQFIFHVSWPPLHYLLFLGVYAVFLFAVPDPFFDGFVKFAYGASALYLLIQIIFLVDFFYGLNEKFADTENLCGLATITVILSVASLVGFGFGYWQFHDNNTSVIVLSVNLSVSVLLFAAAAVIEKASIFTASLIAAYVSFLTFAGCSCTQAVGKVDIVVSVVFSLITLLWAGYSAFTTTGQFGTTCNCDDDQTEKPFSLSFFHGVFALASVYLTMLATNWARPTEAQDWTVGKGDAAMWANWATAFATELLYFWTVIAPFVLPGRDFD